MNRNYKITITAAIMAVALVSGGCVTKPADTNTPVASIEPSIMEPASIPTIKQEPLTPSPAPVTTESQPDAATENLANADGLPPDIAGFLQTYSSEDIAPYNMLFTESTSTDMDGDGSGEVVALKGFDPKTVGGYEYYTGLNILVGGHKLVLRADPGWSFGPVDSELSGTVLDLDKEDEKKELLIVTSSGFGEDEAEPAVKYLLITYTDSTPKVLAALDYLPEATGTGFIKSIQYSNKLAGDYSIAIQAYERYQPDNGFQKINEETVSAMGYTSVPPEQGGGYLTNWDQKVAKKAGEETDITLNKGTEVYFGLFHTKGWIELHDTEGTTLGWLDLNRVDVDQYIGYAVPYSCH